MKTTLIDLKNLLLSIENENTKINDLYDSEKTKNENAIQAMAYVIQNNVLSNSP